MSQPQPAWCPAAAQIALGSPPKLGRIQSMTFSTRPLIILVFFLSLAGTAVAHHKPDHSGGPGQ